MGLLWMEGFVTIEAHHKCKKSSRRLLAKLVKLTYLLKQTKKKNKLNSLIPRFPFDELTSKIDKTVRITEMYAENAFPLMICI